MLKPIKPGATIAVIAPAFPPDPQKTENGIRYLESLGYSVVRGESLKAKHGYFAGNDTLRVRELNQFFGDPQVDAIFCARGGWGTLRLLDKLDYAQIARTPKLLVGYSDITTLQLAIWHKAGVPSFSGPMVAVEMGNEIMPFTEQHFWGQIQNDEETYTFHFDRSEVQVWQEGEAEGTLIGGCLSMVAHQLGTPFMPSVKDAILFLEDVGEEPYKIDRYLAHLYQAGVFSEIRALILGEFIDCEDTNEARRSVRVEDVLKEYFGEVDFPVIYNFPYGHGMRKFTMPIGVPVRLNTAKQQLIVQNPFESAKSSIV